jgi:hypothetical protein
VKTYLKIIIFAIFVGSLFAFIFFFSIKDNSDIIYAYQVGVFKDYQNALAFQENYEYAKIVKDKDYYRVFIAVTTNNQDIINNLIDTNYYIKTLNVSDSTISTIKKYDELLKYTSEDNQKLVLKNMLEVIPDEL